MTADLDPMLKPYKWLNEATIYNKRNEQVPISWILDNADLLVLLFNSKGVDINGIVTKFCEIYENVKYVNLPIEVIYVPMDDTEADAIASYESQANWFTLKFDDPLVPVLKYMYEVTCIPHLIVVNLDGTIVSSHAIFDLVEYGKNAVITWLSTSASIKSHRKLSRESSMYGENWVYMNVDPTRNVSDYQRKFPKD
ncbi:uncharacterized protein [Battus philenor]|uniref:uncharacterized protein n=1 Tax=Battus philenor TaxID=42288 RepID=UPI0035CE9C40